MGLLSLICPHRQNKRAQQRVREFLQQHGQRLDSCEEIVLTGDLLAVVEGRDARFYAFVTGNAKEIRREEFSLFRPYCLSSREAHDGNRKSAYFNPAWFYVAKVNRAGIEPSSEGCASPQEQATHQGNLGDSHRLDEEELDLGVYRITSPVLIERIRKASTEWYKANSRKT